MSQQYQVPSMPRVISPSPTPSELSESKDSYFAPITRSAAAKNKRTSKSPGPISEAGEEDEVSDPELEKRARARSRSPKTLLKQQGRRLSGLPPPLPKSGLTSKSSASKGEPTSQNGEVNGHLSPTSATSYWQRALSRSPSPLGLIPIHRHWRSFIHRHEIPRKFLHVSIGFFTLHLYTRGVQTSSIHPWLLGALIPIASVDFLRHRYTEFNKVYVRCLGALMRESEVHERYNGVIWYLLGVWIALRWFPKDVGVMSVLLLSWCDTAASTFGRLYGRYTPRIRKSKSLAGSAAAAFVGVLAAGVWYGVITPRYWGYEKTFEFKGTLQLPKAASQALGLPVVAVGGWIALGIVSLWSGICASASELVDVWDIDDNLTIPVLSGLGLWGFLKIFG
ncbi:MAG: hypothetical protein MMC33_004135 [Icmadophila ericetorum]|nr:hypothetical protein [Icmadophila ericetorum]